MSLSEILSLEETLLVLLNNKVIFEDTSRSCTAQQNTLQHPTRSAWFFCIILCSGRTPEPSPSCCRVQGWLDSWSPELNQPRPTKSQDPTADSQIGHSFSFCTAYLLGSRILILYQHYIKVFLLTSSPLLLLFIIIIFKTANSIHCDQLLRIFWAAKLLLS